MQKPTSTTPQNRAIGTQRGVVSRSITVGSGGIGLWLGGTGALRPTSETSNQVAHLVPICPPYVSLIYRSATGKRGGWANYRPLAGEHTGPIHANCWAPCLSELMRMFVDLNARKQARRVRGRRLLPLRLTAVRFADFLLYSVVIKAQVTTIFSVEPTAYGWSVSDGATRLGLFVSRRQALDDVRNRRAALKAKGLASSLEVTGPETEGARRPQRFY
jgi:hypothetical protein